MSTIPTNALIKVNSVIVNSAAPHLLLTRRPRSDLPCYLGVPWMKGLTETPCTLWSAAVLLASSEAANLSDLGQT